MNSTFCFSFHLLRLLRLFAAKKPVFIRVHPWLIGFQPLSIRALNFSISVFQRFRFDLQRMAVC